MSITIRSNIASLRAKRMLDQSTSALETSFTRLSSGLRINKASDDAAGLAISESLGADARVLNQGVRNLNDGLSLLNVADAALEQLGIIVIRLQELSEQAANGPLGSAQRAAIDEEAQALSEEFSRIQQSTAFNGNSLLNGDLQELGLQVGYGIDGGITFGIGGAIGDGTFAERITFSTGAWVFSVAASDFNSDGILDLLTPDYLAGQVNISFGVGDGTFADEQSVEVGTYPYEAIAADFNNDGIEDIATCDANDGSVSVLLGVGDGTFSSRISTQVGVTPRSITSADFNGDGILDLATTNMGDSTLSVLLGCGNGTFAEQISYSVGTEARSLQSTDVDGDGLTDLVFANGATDTVSIMFGQEGGSFSSRVTYETGSQPRSVAIGDLNGDGVVDLAASNYADGTISVLLGQGDGTFSEEQSFAVGNGPHSVSFGDFNGDTILDVASIDVNDDTISLLIGNGDGSFQQRTTFSVGDSPSYITAADVSGDGVLDLITVNAGDNSGSVLLGNTKYGVSPLLEFSLKTQADARQALPVFQRKLDQLSAQRSKVGAVQARIAVAINTTKVAVENYQAAKSQITDADIAFESANLIKNKILQQAGAAILAQANHTPALVLQLLQDD